MQAEKTSNFAKKMDPPAPSASRSAEPASPTDEPTAEILLAWSYRWEDSLNQLPEVADPPLPGRILGEMERLVKGGTAAPVIHVRGEMGIGKTEIARILLSTAPRDLAHMLVVEARDLETPSEFAYRINQCCAGQVPLVALARPGTMDIANLSMSTLPSATVTVTTFRQESALYIQCLNSVAVAKSLPDAEFERFARICRSFPESMQTPFFFGEVAEALRGGSLETAGKSALDVLGSALRKRLGNPHFTRAMKAAQSPTGVEGLSIQGIIDGGRFIHDGYRSILLAVGAASGEIPVPTLASLPNVVPAVRFLANHLESSPDEGFQIPSLLIDRIRTFISAEAPIGVNYELYLRALLAESLDRVEGISAHSAVVKRVCYQVIADLRFRATGIGYDSGQLQRLRSTYLWHDVSDALSLLGDDRLPQAGGSYPGPTDPYYSYIDLAEVEIGASGHVPRVDNAKPVLPYAKTVVSVGPLWVANYLCTTDQFAEFWRDPERDAYFEGAGARWVSRDPAMRAAVEESFDATAKRNFWKELQEQSKVRDIQFASGIKSVLDIARGRATGEHRVALWDSAQSDARFSNSGKPVVGVNWWEARAFALWWEEYKISAFPRGSRVDLLTDWEWEAIRRNLFSAKATAIAKQQISSRTFPAHLRAVDHHLGVRDRGLAWRSSPLQPLHVGLFPAPDGRGPTDLIGNVWEWTRSKVFGSIRVDRERGLAEFGDTIWDDGDPAMERNPTAEGRDDVHGADDLAFRAVRGGSFFSIDPDASWHPAYRLCDPPFASYFDLGFRIAVYPPQEGAT